MRKIIFIEPKTLEWNEWKKKCQEETRIVIQAFNKNGKCKINRTYTQRNIKRSFFFSKEGPFKGKCIYCEKAINLTDDLDHFRPKKSVTNFDNNPIYVKIDGRKIKHPGYYWLAYDCHNLLPACKSCNTFVLDNNDRKIGKGQRFPVKENKYAAKSSQIKFEIPLIINPVFDDPKQYMFFNEVSGKIDIKKSAALHRLKARTTINIFGLNFREDLIEGRMEAYNHVITELFTLMLNRDYEKINDIKKEIIDGKGTHTIARIAALEEINKQINVR